MNQLIPYSRQWVDDEDIRQVIEVLKSDFLTTGPKINEFEEKLASYVGVKHAVAVTSGTASLHAACSAAGIGTGDEVITSAMTFAASSNCVLYMGGKPVFCDIDPVTYNLDVRKLESLITERTKAMIPVHYTGQLCEMDEIMNLAKKYQLVVIEDGAHALGGEYKSKKAGAWGDMCTFSFHPVKHVTTGEGGAIVTNSDEYYEHLIMFRSHGMTRNPKQWETNGGPWYYEQHFLGVNYRMTDIQAALGVSQLNKTEMFLKKRREIADRYQKAFQSLEGLQVPAKMHENHSSWHIYVIALELEKLSVGRLEILNELRKKNIGVNVHYIPVYYHPYYKKLGYEKGLCPEAEKLYERIITLPLYPQMEENQIQYVIETVKDTIDRYRYR